MVSVSYNRVIVMEAKAVLQPTTMLEAITSALEYTVRSMSASVMAEVYCYKQNGRYM